MGGSEMMAFDFDSLFGASGGPQGIPEDNDHPLQYSSVADGPYADAFTAAPGALWNLPSIEIETEHPLVSRWRRIALVLVDKWRGSEFSYRAMDSSNMASMAAVALQRNEDAINRLPTQGEYLAMSWTELDRIFDRT
jgi:hypothetical protein